MTDAFQILADPTRRRLVEALRQGEHSVSELVALMDIGQPGVSRQLAILKDANFVVVRPEGQRRLYQLSPGPFRDLNQWMEGYRGMWEQRLDRFSAELDRRDRKKKGEAQMSNATAADTNRDVQAITPVLVFKDRTEEAVNLYVSLFPNSRVVNIVRSDGGPIVAGQVMFATFELDGRPYNAFDGGDTFSFSEGFSMMVTCATQDEIDRLWNRLTENGGEPGRCGWLKDRFGLSWQIVPGELGEMLGNPAGGDTQKAGEAMMTMNKLDIAALRAAYSSRS